MPLRQEKATTMNIQQLKTYEGQIVAVQLNRPLFFLSFGGTAMANGQEHHIMTPALIGDEKTEAVGFAQVLPSTRIEVRDEFVVLRIIDPPTRAELEIGVSPEDIAYVTRVSKVPSMLIKP